MEHRKFKRRLAELITELTPAQGRKLIDAVRERSAGDETQKLIDDRFQADLACPHCQGRRIHRHGCAFRRRRPPIPTHGDHLFRSMTTSVARVRKSTVGCIG